MAISYKASIMPLYSTNDINHMKPYGVMLDDISWATNPAAGGVGEAGPYPDHGNARSVYSYLTGESQPQMPMGETKWNSTKLNLYQQWMSDGFQP